MINYFNLNFIDKAQWIRAINPKFRGDQEPSLKNFEKWTVVSDFTKFEVNNINSK